MNEFGMHSNKPYLVRAFFEWIVDNACTPFLVVNANYPHCKVPLQHVDENGQITLNISSSAVRDLKISNDYVEFRASFGGVIHFVSAPTKAVLAIYAQENGQGMFFDFEEEDLIEEGMGWEEAAMTQKQETNNNTVQEVQKKIPEYLKLVE